MNSAPRALVWSRRRRELELDLRELADRLGVAASTLHGYLGGENITPERRFRLDTELALGKRARGERRPIYLLALMDGANVRGWICDEPDSEPEWQRVAAVRSVELADISVAFLRALGIEAAPVPAWRDWLQVLVARGGDPPPGQRHGDHLIDSGDADCARKHLATLIAGYAPAPLPVLDVGAFA